MSELNGCRTVYMRLNIFGAFQCISGTDLLKGGTVQVSRFLFLQDHGTSEDLGFGRFQLACCMHVCAGCETVQA